MPERILLLGATGVNKAEALANLNEYAKSRDVPARFLSVDFEKDYILKNPRGQRPLKMHMYLDADYERQQYYWSEAWKRFKSDYGSFVDFDKHLFLSLHGVVTRLSSGSRSPINFRDLIDFSPTRIIVLIDDVYAKWDRTERRAVGGSYKGTPTLEQLLDARRTEMFLAEFLAGHVEPKRPACYLLATRHPARSLYRLSFSNAEEIFPIYLSFPISGPRSRLSDREDPSEIEGVNDFLRKASECEQMNPKAVFFCPLTIDEYPLLKLLKSNQETVREEKYKVFHLNGRWDVREFYGEREILLCDGNDLPDVIRVPEEQLNEAAGLIKRDVALRDYRLVTQSQKLAVFNPWFDGKQSKGVRNEMRIASQNMIPCHIYQDPKHDPDGKARATFNPKKGSLGDIPFQDYSIFHNSIDELFQQILR